MAKLLTEESYQFEVHESEEKDLYLMGVFSSANKLNHNNRTYPKETLEREVEKLKESIENRTCLGQIGHPECFTRDIKVLTENGWKYISKVEEKENALTLNKESRKMEYQPVEKNINQYYEGKSIRIYSKKGFDTTVTPNHRFVLYDRYGNSYFATAEELMNNKKKHDHSYIPKKGLPENMEYPSTIRIDGLSLEEANKKRYYKWYYDNFGDDLIFDSEILSAFMGIYLAEGWNNDSNSRKKINKESNTLFLIQSKSEHIKKIDDLLSNFPKEIIVNRKEKGDKVQWSITDIRLARFIKKFGNNCYDKHIPQFVKTWDPYLLNIIVEWFGIGDGRGFLENKKWLRKNIFSTSEKLIDDLHEILVKSGGSGRRKIIETQADYKFAGRVIKCENKNPLHFLEVLSTNGFYITSLNFEEIEHQGKVYCLQIPNEIFYVMENNGFCFWTGNSPETDLTKAAILTEDLQWKDDDVYGKAKVLNTPNGKVLKNLLRDKVTIGISSRGLGSVDEDGTVKEDFALLAYDCVANPSNHSSWLQSVAEDKYFPSPYELKEKNSKIFDCKKVKTQLDKIIRDYKKENQ